MSEKIATKAFVNSDGDTSRSATPDSVGVLFSFSNGVTILVQPHGVPEPAKYEADERFVFHETLTPCATVHGISQKCGDAYASAKKEGGDDPVSWAIDRLTELAERAAEGTWVERAGAAGPRTSLIAEAIVRAATEEGIEYTLEQAKELLETMEPDERRKLATKDGPTPAVYAAYCELQLERQQARLKQAKEKATAGGGLAGIGIQ